MIQTSVIKRDVEKDYSISRPVENPTLRILSFGAGVQSTVMLLKGIRGDFGPRPDAAIFADTKWELKSIYEHLDWVKGEVDRRTNGQVPIYIVSAGDIRQDHSNGLNTTGHRFASMPLYTEGGGMGRRQCTREYKIDPIRKKVRELLGLSKGKHVKKGTVVEQWIGISTDELQRLKENRDKWTKNRWPLIEERMSRTDCISWFEREYPGRPLVKSACLGCPFQDNSRWRALRDNNPEGWLDVCEFDEKIRYNGSTLKGMRKQQYVHRSEKPLRIADLGDKKVKDLFQGECEGMCGV